MIIKCDRIVSEQGILDGYLVVEGGKIRDLVPRQYRQLSPDADATGYTIIPGIFDTHNHGMMGWAPGAGDDAEAKARALAKAYASVGVTSVFPTRTPDGWKGFLAIAGKEVDGATVMGLPSEGPYLNRVGEKGVDTGHPEIDMVKVKQAVEYAGGWLKLVALAPELEHSSELIHYLTAHGVRCAFAHSNCTYSEALAAFREGISVVTHTANVMSGIHHRNMGGLGAALLDDHVYNELIADGLHVRNEMIEIMFRVKHDAFHKFMLISDNVPLAGFPQGQYTGVFPGSVCTITAEGYCVTDTGRLAGSAVPVVRGMKNLVENLHLPLETVCRMASLNPAQVYGYGDRKGSLRVGKDADFVVLDHDFRVESTYVTGRKVYDRNIDTDLVNHEAVEALRVRG
jgi:N-acetylglucosamine-6-phosphate deacetylase